MTQEQNNPSDKPENKPAAQGSKQVKSKKPEKPKASGGGNKTGLVVFLVVLNLISIGAAAYLYLQLGETQDKKEALAQENKQKGADIENLMGDLTAKTEQYNQAIEEKRKLGLSVADLEKERDQLMADIETFKTQLKRKDRNIYALRKEISQVNEKYEEKIKEKEEEIASLQEEVATLETTRDSLRQEQANAKDSIQDLSSKVNIASVLEAENLKITSVNANGKEDDKMPFKSKRTEKVLVKFNLEKNKVAKKDKKSMVVQVIDPTGGVIFDNAGGGAFKTNEDETKMFSMKQEILFDNTQQEVIFPVQVGEDNLVEGIYSVHVFSDGHEIGTTEFEIKEGLF
jgi:predicted nuclease with TOPRIM domain